MKRLPFIIGGIVFGFITGLLLIILTDELGLYTFLGTLIAAFLGGSLTEIVVSKKGRKNSLSYYSRNRKDINGAIIVFVIFGVIITLMIIAYHNFLK